MGDATFKLELKLPTGAEFRAEGPEALVTRYFERFLEIAGHGAANAASSGAVGDTRSLQRLFAIDHRGVVSLREPPSGTTPADTLVLLLYGARRLRDERVLSAPRLMKAAQQSGIRANRLDRIAAAHAALLTAEGAGKARRYALNDAGVRHAEKILAHLAP
jgi:hypothetical protein